MPGREEFLGQCLVRANLVSQEALDEALADQRVSQKSLERILVERGLVTEDQAVKAMEMCYRVPYVDLKSHTVELDALTLVPWDVAREYQALPLSIREKQLTVVMADPEDVMAVDYLKNLTGHKVRVVFSHPEDVKRAVEENYAKIEERAQAVLRGIPSAVGPYRQWVGFEKLLFVSGQIGINPVTGQLAGREVETQARQALKNLRAILEEQGSGLDKILKTTIFLTDIEDFETVNSVYAEFFKKNLPARSTVAVQALPKGALVEIEAIAHQGG